MSCQLLESLNQRDNTRDPPVSGRKGDQIRNKPMAATPSAGGEWAVQRQLGHDHRRAYRSKHKVGSQSAG